MFHILPLTPFLLESFFVPLKGFFFPPECSLLSSAVCWGKVTSENFALHNAS